MLESPIRVIDPRGIKGATLLGKVAEILRYRELLVNLVKKELKVRYKNSALGFFWSMLNPAMYLVIFTIVFKFLGAQIPYFSIFLLSGLLGWNLLASALNGAAGSLVGNANLVTKVYFPREILPLASIGASLIHFCLQFIVLLGGLVVFRYGLDPSGLFLVPFALVVLIVFITGLSLLIASSNVYFRDVQHFLELALLAWFWMTPIVYPIAQVQKTLGDSVMWKLYRLNPMTSIASAFQRGVYGAKGADGVLVDAPISWYVANLSWVLLGSLVLLVIGVLVFHRFESRLAEEL